MANDEWSQPDAPPPPLFLNKKERDLVKQVNDELTERIIGQQILYYAIDLNKTNYHPLYGDVMTTLTIKFHKRRLTEDQDIFVREGDFVSYGGLFYELVTLDEPKQLFGQVDYRYEITAKCVRARKGLFDGR